MHYQIYPSKQQNQAEYLIFSSGLGGHGSFWQPQIEFFRQHFHVLTYDQEGCHAGATLLDRDYMMQDMALQLLGILQEIELEKFHFVGHALGGFIGAELARLIRYTDITMLSLSIINGWQTLDPHTAKCFDTRIALLKHAGGKAYIEAQALFLYPPAWISQNIEILKTAEAKQAEDFPPKHNVHMRLKALMHYEMSEETQMILRKIPLHLIANKDDFLVPFHQSQQLKDQFDHATLTLMERGGHASTVTEKDQINEVIFKFIASQSNYRIAS